MKIITFIILICCLIFILPYNIFADTKTQQYFLSPSGKYKIIFTELEHRKFSMPARDIDEKNHVVYRIDFLDKSSNVLLVSTGYADVYGETDTSKPTDQKLLFQGLEWSPNEDFVILPNEAWASAPGTAVRTAMALNPKLPWKKAEFAFDKFIWTDDLRGIGDRHDDCEYEVSKFDGRFGKTIPIKKAASPIGYELISVQKNKALIGQVNDNCGEYQPPVCFWYDLFTKKENRVLCPAGKSEIPKKNYDIPTKATKMKQ